MEALLWRQDRESSAPRFVLLRIVEADRLTCKASLIRGTDGDAYHPVRLLGGPDPRLRNERRIAPENLEGCAIFSNADHQISDTGIGQAKEAEKGGGRSLTASGGSSKCGWPERA